MTHHEMILHAGVISLMVAYFVGSTFAVWKLDRETAGMLCALGSFALLIAVFAWIAFWGPGPPVPLEPETMIVSA